jgi:hypothetical protein
MNKWPENLWRADLLRAREIRKDFFQSTGQAPISECVWRSRRVFEGSLLLNDKFGSSFEPASGMCGKGQLTAQWPHCGGVLVCTCTVKQSKRTCW